VKRSRVEKSIGYSSATVQRRRVVTSYSDVNADVKIDVAGLSLWRKDNALQLLTMSFCLLLYVYPYILTYVRL